METRHINKRLYLGILLSMFSIILLAQTISASVSYSIPSSVKLGEEFTLTLTGSGLYAVELNVPAGITITSDPSNGVLTSGLYRTAYSGTLALKMKYTGSASSISFSGQYSEGSGVSDFASKSITISNQVASSTSNVTVGVQQQTISTSNQTAEETLATSPTSKIVYFVIGGIVLAILIAIAVLFILGKKRS